MIKHIQIYAVGLLLCINSISLLFGQNIPDIDLRTIMSDLNIAAGQSSSVIYPDRINNQLQRDAVIRIVNTKGEERALTYRPIEIHSPQLRQLLIQEDGYIQESPNVPSALYYGSIGNQIQTSKSLLIYRDQQLSGFIEDEKAVIEFGINSEGKILRKISPNRLDLKTLSMDQCNARHKHLIGKSQPHLKNASSIKEIQLGIVLDHSYVNSAGGLEGAIQKVTDVIAAMSLDFLDGFSFEIQFSINSIVSSACPTCDPWSETLEISELQEEVITWSESQQNLKDSDVILFWSDRIFNDNIIGSAHNGSVCSDLNVAVLRDKSDLIWELRVIVSHEIAHTLGSAHDATQSQTIMNPSLINSNTWSPNSIQAIEQGLASNSCVNDIASIVCQPIEHIQLENTGANSLKVNFENLADSVLIEVVQLQSQQLIHSSVETSNLIWIDEGYQPCETYELRFTPYCEGQAGENRKVIWSSFSINGITIENITPNDCRIEGDIPVYDLTLKVNNQQANSVVVDVNFKGEKTPLTLFSGVHEYRIPSVATDELEDVRLQFLNQNGDYACYGSVSFDEPLLDCAFKYTENFDLCQLPEGWSVVAPPSAYKDYNWKVAGSDRDIQNYGNSANASTSKSINGSCMAIIDDDLVNLSNHTGEVYLESPLFNLEALDEARLSFDYIFDAFEAKGINESHLKVEIYSQGTWQTIMIEDTSICSWTNAWNSACVRNSHINISNYLSSEVKIRWVYSDGDNSKWTGMAAIDNIEIIGAKDIEIPCEENEIYIDVTPLVNLEETGSMVHVNAMINVPQADFSVSEGALFYPGSQIETGVNMNIQIMPCDSVK